MTERDRPWVMRTYSGHSSARASNELYQTNLAKGQTGLSIAFDLPTQTGYDPDDQMARGEVGKVGVPVPSVAEMRALFDGIPIADMNTSMTINATAMWLMALYIAVAKEQGVVAGKLSGTTQNDIMKEYLSRGTFIFPPAPSLRLTVDLITYTVNNVPNWNPINVCSYHLQEAGATPVQEIAFALATAIDILDAVRDSGQVAKNDFSAVVERISFFVNAGIRFVEETCKMRAFTQMWDQICLNRYDVNDEKARRFRYGVQVNSLGLTEAQPENNIQRIVLEALGVTLSKNARARAVQLPAWNEALGLPRPWDQQWSLRIQQVLAFETDLLEYQDIFDGSHVIEAKTNELIAGAQSELDAILSSGGAFANLEDLKSRLVQSHSERIRKIEDAELKIVGVNSFTESAPSLLTNGVGNEDAILVVDSGAERTQVESTVAWRSNRDNAAWASALAEVSRVALTTENLMPATIRFAEAGGTVGEWAGALRACFGEFRAPTGVGRVAVAASDDLLAVRERLQSATAERGAPIRMLVGKPGLDGQSNGAEQIAVAARDAGFEVIYQGIRLTPEQIAAAARDEDVDVVGLSILSGSHLDLVPEVVRLLGANGVKVPVVVGGIIPESDQVKLREAGVAAIYTPKDYRIADIMANIADLVLAQTAQGDSFSRR